MFITYVFTPYAELPAETQIKINSSYGSGEDATKIAQLTRNSTPVYDDTVSGISTGQDIYGNHFITVDGYHVKCKVEPTSFTMQTRWTIL